MILIFLLILVISIYSQKYSKNKITILHTNDIHGNIYRFRPLPWTKADANIAEFNNLILYMKKNAEEAGNEIVLVFDSGDLVQGSGLSEATPVYGTFIFEAISKLPYDAITIGNHELNGEDSIANIVANVAPTLGERYISGNVHHSDSSKSMARPYRLMDVEGFGKILVLGFLYNCTWGNPTVVTTYIADVVKEDWFIKAITMEDLRLIVVIGHMDLNMSEGQALFDTVHSLRQDIPMVFLGGHSHKQQEIVDRESQVVYIQSYCHFELLGIVQLEFDEVPSEETKPGGRIRSAEVNFITTTVDEFMRVSGFSGSWNEWMLPESLAILDLLEDKIAELHLADVVGCLPNMNLMIPEVVDIAYRTVKPSVDPEDEKTKGTIFVSDYPNFPAPSGELFLDDLYTIDSGNTPIRIVRNVTLRDIKEVIYGHPHDYYPSPITVFDYPYYDVIGVAVDDVWNDLIAFNPSANYKLEVSETERNRDVLIKFVESCLVCGDTHIYDCIIPDSLK